MRDIETLCLPPVQEISAKQIRAIRDQPRMRQAVFAAVLNTSVSRVNKWEIGEKRPSGPSLKLLNVIERKGVDALSQGTSVNRHRTLTKNLKFVFGASTTYDAGRRPIRSAVHGEMVWTASHDSCA
jgi:putative transcriptional regulator